MKRLFNSPRPRPGRHWAVVVGLLLIGALVIAGCGGSDDGDSSGSSSDTGSSETTSGSSSSETREAVGFLYTSSSDQYTQVLIKTMEQEASKYGWTLKLVLNEFDQNEENNQVLQELSVGSKPDAYIWAPVDQKAGLAALRKLEATGVPVFQVNAQPTPESEEFIKFYTGTSFDENGETSAGSILAARDALKESGAQLHSPTGNLVSISWPEALTFSALKLEGLENGLGEAGSDAPNWIDKEFAATTDSPGGFKAMNTAIAKVGSQGIDVVFAYNDGLAEGAIQALKAAGLQPGKDVMVVGGNCFGDFSSLVDGSQFSSMVVGAPIEAKMFIGTMTAYFEGGEQVEEGTFTAPADPGEEPTLPEVPSKSNYIPQPALIVGKGSPSANQKAIDQQTLWGQSVSELCGVE